MAASQAVGVLSKLIKPDFADVDPKAAAAAAYATGAAAAAATGVALTAQAPHPLGHLQQVTIWAAPLAYLVYMSPWEHVLRLPPVPVLSFGELDLDLLRQSSTMCRCVHTS